MESPLIKFTDFNSSDPEASSLEHFSGPWRLPGSPTVEMQIHLQSCMNAVGRSTMQRKELPANAYVRDSEVRKAGLAVNGIVYPRFNLCSSDFGRFSNPNFNCQSYIFFAT
jgi:hypothetical protein